MKILSIQKWFVAAGLAAFLAGSAQAQNNTQSPDVSVVNSTAPTVAVSSTPALANSVSQVLQLSQAKISDNTIVSFIQNSGTTYPLAASQIVYLKQQGVSDLVLNAMLNQHPAMTASTQPAPASTAEASASAEVPSATAPTTTYVESAPPSSVYVIPDTQTYYYDSGYYGYPYGYYGYPPVGVVIGFGGGWGWGGYGGWHGGYGGFHGGGFGGGFHGGGGFRR